MMSKNRLYTILCIIMVAVLSLGATITAIVVSRSEFTKRDEMHGCVMTSLIQNLKSDLNQVCKRSNLLDIQYDRKKVNCGDVMTKDVTSRKPTSVTFESLDQEKTYLLMMMDPDAPNSSVEDLTFFVHWIVPGITVDELASGEVERNNALDYMGPSPPKNKDFHRYQFILFEQTTGSDVILDSPKRGQFKLEDFLEINKLCRYIGLFEFRVKT